MRAQPMVALAVVALACAGPRGLEPADVERYRLGGGADWTRSGEDRVLDDLLPRYPDYFQVVFEERYRHDINLRELRDDLERAPVDRRNYDALNAIAIGYFELNARAERLRGSGTVAYIGGSMQAAKLAAVPWRAYREIREPELRDAILDFFDDAARGEKPASTSTNPRLAAVVESLHQREEDPGRQARIRAISARLAASGP